MTNRFASMCHHCGTFVAAGDGWLLGKSPSHKWMVSCLSCRVGTTKSEPRAEASSEEFVFVDYIEKLREWLRANGEIIGPPVTGRSVPLCFVALGLEPPVDQDAVKKRFRQLAKEHHPDKGGDPKRFIALESAYRDALQLTGGGR
jgi:hypothetical protein